MAPPPKRRSDEAWTVFGRRRRPRPAQRRLGAALLLVALILTVLWARTPRQPLHDDGPTGRPAPPASARAWVPANAVPAPAAVGRPA